IKASIRCSKTVTMGPREHLPCQPCPIRCLCPSISLLRIGWAERRFVRDLVYTDFRPAKFFQRPSFFQRPPIHSHAPATRERDRSHRRIRQGECSILAAKKRLKPDLA